MDLTLQRTMRGEDKKQSSMLMLMSPHCQAEIESRAQQARGRMTSQPAADQRLTPYCKR